MNNDYQLDYDFEPIYHEIYRLWIDDTPVDSYEDIQEAKEAFAMYVDCSQKLELIREDYLIMPNGQTLDEPSNEKTVLLFNVVDVDEDIVQPTKQQEIDALRKAIEETNRIYAR